MMGEALCSIFAIGIMFSKSEGMTSDFRKMLLAVGFMLVASIFDWNAAYREAHKKKE